MQPQFRAADPAAVLSALAAAGALTAADAGRAAAAARPGESAPAAAARLGLIGWEAMGRAAAQGLGLRWMEAREVAALPGPPVGGPAAAFLRSRRAVVADGEGGALAVLADPFDAALRRALTMATPGPLGFAVAAPAAIEAWLDARLAEGGARPAPEAESTPAPPGPAAETADALLETAARLAASDLHFEPDAAGGRARARVDGAMRTLMRLDRELYGAVVARLMVIAELDVAERRLPQDGRGRRTLQGRPVDLRLSTAPALDGLSLAIRLLDGQVAPGRLDALGLPAEVAALMGRAAAAPYGLFALTGPTGSGKTTTLHAMLAGMDAEARKIMTVEDPVEYALPGVVQCQVRADIGFDFASAQRTLLRHNPDVMMVGEIRDRESAAVAVQAALTGHLVLTTVHANTAAGAALRLLDLGVEPFLLAAALVGAGGQRLARRLCPDCREPDAPPAEALARLGAPPGGRWSVARGCPRCGGTGVRGRVPVAEAFLATQPFRDLLRAGAPDETALARLAAADGSAPMHAAALALAAAGEIALAEALRVAPPPTPPTPS